MITVAENFSPDSKVDLVGEINKNPLGITIPTDQALEWPHVHLTLCAVYAKNVLKGRAFVPK